jgi:hypothetical protein
VAFIARSTDALDALIAASEAVIHPPAASRAGSGSLGACEAGRKRRPGSRIERHLDHVHQEWSAQPRHRDPIFARDRWRCAVPACTSRRNLHDHHLLFRSRGGSNARQNRITVCVWHHLRGIHQGRVRARGTAPDAVTWQLGCRPGQAALLTLQGDRYLEEGAAM